MGMWIDAAILENSMEVLKNLKTQLPCDPTISSPGHLAEENENTNFLKLFSMWQ